MYWSKYNIVFESPYGRFIYNTFTNNLMEMNASLISQYSVNSYVID